MFLTKISHVPTDWIKFWNFLTFTAKLRCSNFLDQTLLNFNFSTNFRYVSTFSTKIWYVSTFSTNFRFNLTFLTKKCTTLFKPVQIDIGFRSQNSICFVFLDSVERPFLNLYGNFYQFLQIVVLMMKFGSLIQYRKTATYILKSSISDYEHSP